MKSSHSSTSRYPENTLLLSVLLLARMNPEKSPESQKPSAPQGIPGTSSELNTPAGNTKTKLGA